MQKWLEWWADRIHCAVRGHTFIVSEWSEAHRILNDDWAVKVTGYRCVCCGAREARHALHFRRF